MDRSATSSLERGGKKKTPRELIQDQGDKFHYRNNSNTGTNASVSPTNATKKSYLSRNMNLGKIHTLAGIGISSKSQ